MADERIGVAMAGVYPDCRALLDRAVEEALAYLKQFRSPIPIKKLAHQLAEYVHIFTLGISRPFGCSLFLSAWDETSGSHLYLIEPSGLCYEYRAWAVGKHRQAAKTEIEKLKLEELGMDALIREAVRIVMTVRDETKEKNVQIEMGWVGRNTGGKHQTVPADVVQQAEQWAKSKLEEEDMDE